MTACVECKQCDTVFCDLCVSTVHSLPVFSYHSMVVFEELLNHPSTCTSHRMPITHFCNSCISILCMFCLSLDPEHARCHESSIITVSNASRQIRDTAKQLNFDLDIGVCSKRMQSMEMGLLNVFWSSISKRSINLSRNLTNVSGTDVKHCQSMCQAAFSSEIAAVRSQLLHELVELDAVEVDLQKGLMAISEPVLVAVSEEILWLSGAQTEQALLQQWQAECQDFNDHQLLRDLYPQFNDRVKAWRQHERKLATIIEMELPAYSAARLQPIPSVRAMFNAISTYSKSSASVVAVPGGSSSTVSSASSPVASADSQMAPPMQHQVAEHIKQLSVQFLQVNKPNSQLAIREIEEFLTTNKFAAIHQPVMSYLQSALKIGPKKITCLHAIAHKFSVLPVCAPC